MQTSDESRSKRTVKNSLLSLLAIIIAIVVADVILCLVLEPYGSHTETVWAEYRNVKSMDTALVGSSTTAYGLDPQIIDEVLGAETFNMGTPGQTLDNTLMSLETAYNDHGIKRAIIFIGYESMIATPYINSAIAVTQAKCVTEGPLEALSDVGRLVFNEAFFGKHFSLTCAFPWSYNHVDYIEGDWGATFDNIAANVQNRMECSLLEASARYSRRVLNSEWYYRSQGFGGVHAMLGPDYAHNQLFVSYPDGTFSEYNVARLAEICSYCKAHDIELYVVGSPYPYATVRTYGLDYVQGMKQVQEIATNGGAHFFDLNMAHRDLFDPVRRDYCDHAHLSSIGAPKASRVVAQLIQRVEQGEDISDQFYDYSLLGWRAYCDSADFVGLIDYDYEINDGSAIITAKATTGSHACISFRLDVCDPDTNEWSTVRDYDENPTFILPPEGEKTLDIRVYARSASSSRDQKRWVEGTIAF